MLSWLRRDRSGDYARELAELDRSARAATREARGHLLNRCGDLCAANNDKGEALRYYGDAVDSYLSAGFAAPAAAMCRKILRLVPTAVRAHGTLACLAAYENQAEEARQRIDRFVDASTRSHTQQLTIARLRLMHDAMEDAELLRHIARRLAELGDELGAERIEAALRDSPHLEREPGAWERVLKATTADPDDLWKFA